MNLHKITLKTSSKGNEIATKLFCNKAFMTLNIIIWLIIGLLSVSIILLVPVVHADEGHITLLTVAEDADHTGGAADLYLRMERGTGAVFVDSFPLTKIDTQSSIRYANRIACDYLQKDCTQYNFYYTIRANSAIVGGPSAGAAITVLTIGVLDNQAIDQGVAITGTINSGGIIGPVAGITSKVKGARSAGITTVLIPAIGELKDEESNISTNSSNKNISSKSSDSSVINSSITNSSISNSSIRNSSINSSNSSIIVITTNQSINQTAHIIIKQTALQEGIVKELSSGSFRVIRVSTIEDALWYATAKNYSKVYAPVIPSAEYVARMSLIADDICNRNKELRLKVLSYGVEYNDTNNYTARAQNTTRLYSKASLCFSGDIELARLEVEKFSLHERVALFNQLRQNASIFSAELHDKNLNTISDLETYAIVQERILDTKKILDELNESNPDAETLGYARERFLSAKIWTTFFDMPGRSLPKDREYLRTACLSKLSEAEERVNYVRLYAPAFVGEADNAIEDARTWAKEEPVLCIFSASKATAQANLLSSVIVVGEDNIDALIAQKLQAADLVLRREQQAGFFPIIGYSYLEYSKDLRTIQPYSSLNFAEYALELSTLDIYFPKEHSFSIAPVVLEAISIFFFGALLGATIVFIIMKRFNDKIMSSKNNVRNHEMPSKKTIPESVPSRKPKRSKLNKSKKSFKLSR